MVTRSAGRWSWAISFLCSASIVHAQAQDAISHNPGARSPDMLRLTEDGAVTALQLPDGPVFHRTAQQVTQPRLIRMPGSNLAVVVWTETAVDGATTDWFAVSLDGRTVQRVRQAQTDVRLTGNEFDPKRGLPTIPQELSADADNQVYLVQFVAQPLPEFLAGVRHAGAIVHKYTANNAYIVSMTSTAKTAVEGLPYVRWVGPFHPAFRIEPFVRDRLAGDPAIEPAVSYNVLLLDRNAQARAGVAERIARLGGVVENERAGPRRIVALLTPEQVVQVAHFNEVHFIDRWFPGEPDMDIARELSGGQYFHDTLELTGEGVRGEVMDVGILQTHDDFNPPPLIHGNPPGVSDHGTSTYGINFADGNFCQKGLMPDGIGIYANSTVGDRYTHTGELVDPELPYKACFQTNSWGGGLTTEYTTVSADMDEMLFDFEVTIFQSQSNTGSQLSRPEAWAKNIISCGGVEHFNTLQTTDDGWFGSGSIGPASDGRIKPDLAHFYDSVATTTSGSDQSCTSSFGGTSAATPITAAHSGLWFQFWHTGSLGNIPAGTVFDSRPQRALTKAMLICNAEPWNFSGENHDLTRVHQGWGRVNIKNIYDRRENTFWVNETDPLAPLEERAYPLEVGADAPSLRAVLCYTDPPGNPATQSQHRINDLTLKVTSPSGVVYWGNNGLKANMWSPPGGGPNTKDTVECVFVQDPEAGVWLVEIHADEINEDSHVETEAVDADYALVVTGVSCDSAEDCNTNGIGDVCDIVFSTSTDCDTNATPDECDLTSGTVDCDTNGILDRCEIDCNTNNQVDSCDIEAGVSIDCQTNGIPDECDGSYVDCNTNGASDLCDVLDGAALDCDLDNVPNECDDWAIFSAEGGNSGGYTSMRLGPDGLMTAAYYHGGNTNLRLWHDLTNDFVPDQGERKTIDTLGDVGEYASLTFDPNGLATISYYRDDLGNLKVWHDTNADYGWNSGEDATIDSAGNVGEYTSAAFGPDGRLTVSYYGGTTSDLRVWHDADGDYAFDDGEIAVIHGQGLVGQFTSLAFDPSGLAVVTYYDATNDDLRLWRDLDGDYVHDSGERVAIDTAGEVGSHTRLVFDPAGRAVVAYYDVDQQNLKLWSDLDADFLGDDDEIVTIDSNGNVGQYPAIAFDYEGRLLVSYFRADLDNLKLWFDKNDNRSADPGELSVVHSQGDVGRYGAIIFHPVIFSPLILYRDDTTGALLRSIALDWDGDGLCYNEDECPARRTGDVSGDGQVNSDDIPSFVATLLNPSAGDAPNACAADCNSDHQADGQDIASFLDLINGG